MVNEDILPNPNLDFGLVTSPYLPLKLNFLLGEQKMLKKQLELVKKNQRGEEIKEKKLSIIEELIVNFPEKQTDLHKLNYSLEKWVEVGAIKDWQADILLTLGLKTIPQYNYFELTCFAVEKICNKPLPVLLEEEYSETEEYLVDYQKYLEFQRDKPILINKEVWNKYVSSPQEIFTNLNLERINQ